MPTAQSTKKRTRNEMETDSEGSSVTLAVSTQPEGEVGPVLTNFTAVKPSKHTPFQVYALAGSKSKDAQPDFTSKRLHVAGENEVVEFMSSSETQSIADSGSKYLIGVFNKKTRKVVLRPAPFHTITRQVKALKDLAPPPVTQLQRVEARATLGETFGTKKAQAAIRAAARNKVDVVAMEGVTGFLQNTISSNTASLPTQEEAKTTADENRLIPPYHLDADTAAGVYRLYDIIPENEFTAIPVASLLAAESNQERKALLPYKQSSWIDHHLSGLKPSKHQLKIIYYIAILFTFRSLSGKVSERQFVEGRLRNVPSIIIDGLYSRFTATSREATKVQITSEHQTKILTYLLALCLHVDNFTTDNVTLGADLKISTAQVNQYFKSLGCKIESLSLADVKRLNLPDSAKSSKVAILKLPLEFPKPRTKRRN